MGVLIKKESDDQMYKDAHEEAQRIIRISDEVRISLETVQEETPAANVKAEKNSNSVQMLTTSKLAKQLGVSTKDLQEKLISAGYVRQEGEAVNITPLGEESGGQPKAGRYGNYILWPDGLLV